MRMLMPSDLNATTSESWLRRAYVSKMQKSRLIGQNQRQKRNAHEHHHPQDDFEFDTVDEQEFGQSKGLKEQKNENENKNSQEKSREHFEKDVSKSRPGSNGIHQGVRYIPTFSGWPIAFRTPIASLKRFSKLSSWNCEAASHFAVIGRGCASRKSASAPAATAARVKCGTKRGSPPAGSALDIP